MTEKPWTLLNPNDFQSMWWRQSEILDINTCQYQKETTDILAYLIIQDENMCGNFWYFNEWYINDPNRYSMIISTNEWPFNKELTNMIPGDIIFLTKYPDIRFYVYYSQYSRHDQLQFCKILERIISPNNE